MAATYMTDLYRMGLPRYVRACSNDDPAFLDSAFFRYKDSFVWSICPPQLGDCLWWPLFSPGVPCSTEMRKPR